MEKRRADEAAKCIRNKVYVCCKLEACWSSCRLFILKQKGDEGFGHMWSSYSNGLREEYRREGAPWWWNHICKDLRCRKPGWTSALSSSLESFWEGWVSRAAQSISTEEKGNEWLLPDGHVVRLTKSHLPKSCGAAKWVSWSEWHRSHARACTFQKAILHFYILGRIRVLWHPISPTQR